MHLDYCAMLGGGSYYEGFVCHTLWSASNSIHLVNIVENKGDCQEPPTCVITYHDKNILFQPVSSIFGKTKGTMTKQLR